jgi:hypothetical protein
VFNLDESKPMVVVHESPNQSGQRKANEDGIVRHHALLDQPFADEPSVLANERAIVEERQSAMPR